MSRSSLQEIADRAQLAKSTVSMVLNGDARARVSPEKRALIRQLVRELNYQPSRTAAALRRKRTDMLGMVISDIRDPYFANLAEAALVFCGRRGFQLLFALSRCDQEQERRGLENLLNRQVDGIFHSPFLAPDAPLAERLQKLSTPLLLREQKLPGFSSVGYDRREAVRRAVTDLKAQGCRRLLLLITETLDDPAEYRSWFPASEHVSVEPLRPGIMETVLKIRPDGIYSAQCSFIRELLLTPETVNGAYRPRLATIYTFPEDRINSTLITGYVVNPFFRMVETAMNELMDRVEKKSAATANIQLPCEYLSSKDFSVVCSGLPDTLEKYEQQTRQERNQS